jgi:hypothetical protein
MTKLIKESLEDHLIVKEKENGQQFVYREGELLGGEYGFDTRDYVENLSDYEIITYVIKFGDKDYEQEEMDIFAYWGYRDKVAKAIANKIYEPYISIRQINN